MNPSTCRLPADLSEFTMAQTDQKQGIHERAVFEFAEQLVRRPESLRAREPAPVYPVLISPIRQDMAQTANRRLFHHKGDTL